MTQNFMSRHFTVMFFSLIAIPIIAYGIKQNSCDSPMVVSAVAPNYPPLAISATVQGKVVIGVEVDSQGKVQSTEIVEGPKLLQKPAETAAKKWLFDKLTERTTKSRKTCLTFIFTLMPKKTQSEDLTPVFSPPYQIEVRENTARIIPNANVYSHKE